MTSTITRNRPLTIKQEAFALRLFKGENQREAYLAVYHCQGSLASIDVAASELAHLPKVIVRLKELRDALESPDIGTVSERKKRLTNIYRANLVDFLDEKGQVKLSKDIPHHSAVSEYSVTTLSLADDEVVTKRRLKLRDPVTAIQEQNKMERIGATDSTIINFNEIKILVVREEPRALPPPNE